MALAWGRKHGPGVKKEAWPWSGGRGMALVWGRRHGPGLGEEAWPWCKEGGMALVWERTHSPGLREEAWPWSKEGTGRKSEGPVMALASEVEVQVWLPPSVLNPPHHPFPRQFLSPCVRPNLPTALLHHQRHHQPLDKHRLAGLLL